MYSSTKLLKHRWKKKKFKIIGFLRLGNRSKNPSKVFKVVLSRSFDWPIFRIDRFLRNIWDRSGKIKNTRSNNNSREQVIILVTFILAGNRKINNSSNTWISSNLVSEVNTFPVGQRTVSGSQIYPRYGATRWPYQRVLFPFFLPRDFSIETEKKGEETRRAITVWQGFPLDGGGRAHTRKGWNATKGRKRGLGACALTQQYGEFCEAAQYPPDHQLINILPHTRHVIRAAHACHASCEPLRV